MDDGPGMILDPLEDLAAVCGAATPAALWRYLVTTPTSRAEPNDFEALVAFKRLHSQGAGRIAQRGNAVHRPALAAVHPYLDRPNRAKHHPLCC